MHVQDPNTTARHLQVQTSTLPVMVFVHGGAFIFGDADTVGGAAMPLLTKDIVLVSMQYRLGTLGQSSYNTWDVLVTLQVRSPKVSPYFLL